jgi:hypothetical protein
MVLTAAQTTAFFTGATQMALAAQHRAALQSEGIVTIEDLAEFESTHWAQVVTNLKYPEGIPDPANRGQFLRAQTLALGAKSLERLKIAAEAARYYEAIGRALTPNNMHYTNTLKTFGRQWKAICSRRDQSAPAVPKITRNLKVMKWAESMKDFWSTAIGVRNAPLAYVTRETVAVANPAPALLINMPYSEAHGSIEMEMVERFSHDDAVYRDDNATCFNYLEEATRSTVVAATIQPHKRRRDGRGAWLAILSQHCGNDKWESEIKTSDDFLKTKIWKGNTNHSLEKFLEQHRSAYITLQSCAEHLDYQLPNDRTRVTYLMDAIKCTDPGVIAAMSHIRLDDGANGMRNNFEMAVTFLLPTDPIIKKKASGDKRPAADISSVEIKKGTGNTGVELRYYDHADYMRLSPDQKHELKEWRTTSAGKAAAAKKPPGKRKWNGPERPNNKQLRKTVASLMAETSKEGVNSATEISEIQKCLISFMEGTRLPPKPATALSVQTSDAAAKAAIQLQGILRQGRK